VCEWVCVRESERKHVFVRMWVRVCVRSEGGQWGLLFSVWCFLWVCLVWVCGCGVNGDWWTLLFVVVPYAWVCECVCLCTIYMFVYTDAYVCIHRYTDLYGHIHEGNEGSIMQTSKMFLCVFVQVCAWVWSCVGVGYVNIEYRKQERGIVLWAFL